MSKRNSRFIINNKPASNGRLNRLFKKHAAGEKVTVTRTGSQYIVTKGGKVLFKYQWRNEI